MTTENSQEALITEEGLRRLESMLADLTGRARGHLAERMRNARATMSDTREGPEYLELLQESDLLEGRIADLQARIGELRVVEQRAARGVVSIGSRVVVDIDGERRRYTVVGSDEADPLGGLISNQSPLGAALLGRRRGDEVEWLAPDGRERGRVVQVA